jgi:hypothetical protein
MPLKENVLFGSQIFFVVFLKFVLFWITPTEQEAKDVLIWKESFPLDNTYTASARSITGRYVDPPLGVDPNTGISSKPGLEVHKAAKEHRGWKQHS